MAERLGGGDPFKGRNEEQPEENFRITFTRNSLRIRFTHDIKEASGEVIPATTGFVVRHDEGPLYAGLTEIHQENPDVLRRVIANLTIYKEGTPSLTEEQGALIQRAVDGLGNIINPPEADFE